LEEKIALIQGWFDECVKASRAMDKSQVDAIIVAEFFVGKGLFTEADSSLKSMVKSLGLKVAENNTALL
jgi:hypothetical protein